METHYFWAFFIIALIVGITFGVAYTNSTITGAAIFPRWFWQREDVDVNGIVEPTCAQSGGVICGPNEICDDKIVEASDTKLCCIGKCIEKEIVPELTYCEITTDFVLRDKNNIFHVEKCEKVIYKDRNKRYEVIFHEAFYHPVREGRVAHIEYKEYYIGSIQPCNHQDLVLKPEDVGFVVEVLELTPGPADRAILVIPERLHEDYCLVTGS